MQVFLLDSYWLKDTGCENHVLIFFLMVADLFIKEMQDQQRQ